MNIDHIRQVYLIGIGGIGMSGLARYFHRLGCRVSGYDKTETALTRQLATEGISIIYTDDFALVDDVFKPADGHTLIIYTPAVPRDLGLISAFRQAGHELYKRSQVLGLISERRYTIAVAGTHGKTTTSTLIAHILKDSGYDCSAFLGGISVNYNTNVLFANNQVMVVEADEYDRSFLTLHPDIAVVTSADADHLDVYGDKEHLHESFQLFLSQLVDDGLSIVKAGLPFEGTIRYAVEEPAQAYATNIRIERDTFYFDYVGPEGCMVDVHLGVPGRHNIENAVAAITVAHRLGIADEAIARALSSFAGVKRRFEYIVKHAGHIYIDDYAHHPEELRAFLTAVRQLYPERQLTVVFQPHLYSRTRDFADGFAEVLSMADTLLLMDIYPARELPIEGVSSRLLLDKVTVADKRLLTPEGVKDYVGQHRPALLVTVGAGDIDLLVEPLKAILMHA